jgi:hypothetical protein
MEVIVQNTEQNKREMPVFSQRELALQSLVNMQADEIRGLRLKISDMEEMIENLTGDDND